MKNKLLTISLILLLSGCSRFEKPQSATEANYYLDNYCDKSHFDPNRDSKFNGQYCNAASNMLTSSIDQLLNDETLNKLVRRSLEEDVLGGSSSTCNFKGGEEINPYCIAINKRISQLGQNENYSAHEIQSRYIELRNAGFMAYRKAKAESQANLILEQAEN